MNKKEHDFLVKKQSNQLLKYQETKNNSEYSSFINDIKSYKTKNFNDYLVFENKMLDNYVKYEPLQSVNMPIGMAEQHKKEHSIDVYSFIEGKKLLNEYLIGNNLPPASLRYGTSNVTFTLSLLNHLCSFLGIFIFIILFGLNSVKDFENKNIKLIAMLPIKRGQIFFIDLLFFIIESTAFLIFLIVTSFFIGTLFGEYLPTSYPVITSVNNLDLTITPIGKVIIYSAFLFLLTTIIGYLFFLLVSLYIRKLIPSLMMLVVLSIGIITLSNIPSPPSLNTVTSYNPFCYFNSVDLFLGSSYEPIGEIDDGYVETDMSSNKIKGGDYWIIYENYDYYSGNTVAKQINNNSISFKKGVISSLALLILLIGLVSNRYVKKMAT